MTPPTPDDFQEAQRESKGQMMLAAEVVVCVMLWVVAVLGYIAHRWL